jgi:hypothetical protein
VHLHIHYVVKDFQIQIKTYGWINKGALRLKKRTLKGKKVEEKV